MSNIIDMASFEHLRRSTSSERYRCPKTEILFPHIYRVEIPDGELVEGAPQFTGKFSDYYQLSKSPCYTNSELPGFPESPATIINTLPTGANFYLELIHLKDKQQAEGFKQACFLFGMDLETLSDLENSQGVFILLTRKGNSRKNGHIFYRTSKEEYIKPIGKHLPCEYVAAFDSERNIKALTELTDAQDE